MNIKDSTQSINIEQSETEREKLALMQILACSEKDIEQANVISLDEFLNEI